MRNTTQANTPSIPSYTVHVPLPFWFTEEGQALPLVALQYYTVDITLNLTPANQLFTVLDMSGNRMAPGYRILSPLANIQNNIPDIVATSDSTTQLRNFMTDINQEIPQLNTWTCNPTIHTTYVFLPEKERTLFAATPLIYLTRQVTLIPIPEIISNEIFLLDIHNPITRLILVPRRSDSVLYKNNLTNFTNWWNYPTRPKRDVEYTDNSQFIETTSATGLLVPNAQMDIIKYIRVLADGNEIQEIKPNSFYTNLTSFKYLSGGANRNLPVITFELHTPTPQPAGSLNSSRIRKFQLDLQVYPLPPNSTYIYSVNVYVENINFFIVESGMGDNKYAL
jgi:hypothetical protein